jgi:hypothetical protein
MKTTNTTHRLIAFEIVFFSLISSMYCSNGIGSGKDSTFMITIFAGIFGFLAMLGLKLWFDKKQK